MRELIVARQQDGSTDKPYHHGDLRRALITAALEILNQEQDWSFTLRELARRAGVSHAAPYRHFADKQELLAEVAALGFEALRQRLLQVQQQVPEDSKAQLSAMGEAYVVFAVEHPAHFRLMFGPDLAGEQRFPALIEAATATREVMADAVQRSAGAGLFGANDPQIQALAAWSLVHGLAMLLIDQRVQPMPTDIHGLAAAITHAFVHGARAE